MKNKRILPIVILGITILISGSFLISKVDAITGIKSMGELFREQKASQDNDTVAIGGNNITITEKEIEDKVDVYLQTGDMNAVDSAVQHLLERKVLYNKAISEGFSVSDEELDTEIEKLKEVSKKAENYSEYEEFINGYGGEDAYFDDMKEDYRISITINKYLMSEQEKYEVTGLNQKSSIDSDNLSANWNSKKNELITELINNENIIIKNEKYKNISLNKKYENVKYNDAN